MACGRSCIIFFAHFTEKQHVRWSHVTFLTLLIWKTARKTFSCYIFDLLFRKTARKTFSRYIFDLLFRKTARKTFSRYIFDFTYPKNSTQDVLALHFWLYLSEKQHARRSRVTFSTYFSEIQHVESFCVSLKLDR